MILNRIKDFSLKHFYFLSPLLVSICAMILLGYGTSLILNWDISWFMITTERLFKGHSYGEGFFEISPPIIYLLMFPPWLIYHYLHINLTICFYSYVTVLTWVSCFFCSKWIKERWEKSHPQFSKWLYLSIILGLYIFPLSDYGQKDYLFWVFFLPYLFSIIHQLHHERLSWPLGLFIGCWLFLGVGIKHYFLIPVITIESFMMIQKRNYLAWLKPEIISLAVLCIIYLMVIKIFFHPYLADIVPIALKIHYISVAPPLTHLIFSKWMFLLLIFNITLILGYQTHPFKKEAILFNIVMNACALVFLSQRTLWNYHAYPLFACFILNLTSNLMSFENIKKNTLSQLFFISYSTFFLFIILLQNTMISILNISLRHPIIVKLAGYLKNHQNAYFINTDFFPQMQAYQTAEQPFLSRYPDNYWIRAIDVDNLSTHHLNAIKKLNQDVSYEINNLKPQYIIMNRFKYLDMQSISWHSKSNLFQYLSNNSEFINELNNYSYHETLSFSYPSNKSFCFTITKIDSRISKLPFKSNEFVAFKDENYKFAYHLINNQFQMVRGQVERFLLTNHSQKICTNSLKFDVYQRKDIHTHD